MTAKSRPIITVCASISFYEQVMGLKDVLENNGLKVSVPELAELMAKQGDFRLESYLESWCHGDFEAKKSEAIKTHFDKIAVSDGVLVLNLEKNGNKAYIGPNVLMEMGLTFYLKKPIFIWRKIEDDDRFREEILAMKPVWVDEKVSVILNYYKG